MAKSQGIIPRRTIRTIIKFVLWIGLVCALFAGGMAIYAKSVGIPYGVAWDNLWNALGSLLRLIGNAIKNAGK